MYFDANEPVGKSAARPGGFAGYAVGNAREDSSTEDFGHSNPSAQSQLSAASLAGLFKRLREFLVTLDEDGIIRGLWSSNSAESRDLEAMLLGHSLREVMSAGTSEWIAEVIKRAIESDRIMESQYSVELDDGKHTFSLAVIPVAHEARGTKAIRLVSRDATQQARDLLKLKQSEALLTHAERIANFGSWEFDVTTRRPRLSGHLLQMFSLASNDDWTDEIYWERMHPNDRERIRALIGRAVALSEPFSHVSRYLPPDGGVRVHFARSVPVIGPEGKVVRWIGVIQDITGQARAEEELRRLTQELMRARDDDRRHMARELHASAGQSLAALKMSLGRLGSELPRGKDLAHELLNSAIELAEGAIREVRTVSYLMHPPMLDEAGLASALRWYADGFAKRSGIRVRVDVPEDFGRHSQEIETTVFRIVQEALTNVHRYSGSRTATIQLGSKDGQIRAEVRDEGCGLPPAGQVAGCRAPLGVGIASIRERVKQLNGAFEIQSAPGQGTTVRVTLPTAAERPQGIAAVHELPPARPKLKTRARRRVKHASRR